MDRYINTDERYGEQEEATLEDYRELNPEGVFQEWSDWYFPGSGVYADVIVEWIGDRPVVVAERRLP